MIRPFALSFPKFSVITYNGIKEAVTMSEYKNILIAIDGSEQSEKALEQAINIAKKYESTIYLLAVLNSGDLNVSTEFYHEILEREKSKIELELAIVEEKVKVRGYDDVKSKFIISKPKQVIVSYSKEKNIDLIIMGATGKGSVGNVIMGSTATYVVNHAPCTVMIVR